MTTPPLRHLAFGLTCCASLLTSARSQEILDPIPAPIATGPIAISLTPVAAGLEAPNYGVGDPVGAGRFFVSDQSGQLWAYELNGGVRTLFLDVSSRLVALGIFGAGSFDERGFLGFAFHPDYTTNGLLYTYTSEPVSGAADFSTMPAGMTADHQSVILEWAVPNPTDPASVVDPNSARELMRIDEPQFNHDGGCIAFGPDGLLYFGVGDGGGADDEDGEPFFGAPLVGHGPNGNGRDKTTILGTIGRIDPQGNNSANGAYGIPADNPFVAPDPGLDEIYAYGFRNPWRFSFDTLTGTLYAADVGQNDIEEVDVVVKGGHYGWNYREGSFFFDPNSTDPGFVTSINSGGPANMIGPQWEYDHDEGVSVTGGFVYRGAGIPALSGKYVFADWSQSFFGNNGRLFYTLGPGQLREFTLINALGISIHGFGQDNDGELYVMTTTTGTPFGGTGMVYRIDAQQTASCIFRNGSGINPADYRCLTLPVLGTNWDSAIDTNPNTVATLVGLAALPDPGIPLFGGEFLLGVVPAPLFISGLGSHSVAIPSSTVFLGAPLATQGLRVDMVGGFAIPTLLNAQDLVLGF